ncbi:MAG TPA: DUF2332 domain-containing protein [Devosia sp.]|nr:DUF2332 domain-containing protein [Devosia sp.]
MTKEQAIRDSFAVQAHWCSKLGSPFTAQLLKGLGENLNDATRTGRTVLHWKGQADAMGDALALRLAGALHGLVRAGKVQELASFYPPNPVPSKGELADAAMTAIAERDEEVFQWLAFAPQTNEVARSGILYPGMRLIAQKTGLPLSLFELGASAGLNLIPDRFAYGLGGKKFGQTGSPVLLAPHWCGPDPKGSEPEIVVRRGCDTNPLDISNPAQRARLMAYIWPDQLQRLDRAKQAIMLAQENRPEIEKADAAHWVEENISHARETGVTLVLFHSIAFQYFKPQVQLRIKRHMERTGARATPDAPLAWLAFEQGQGQSPGLTLRLWGTERRSDEQVRLLAKSNNAHCHKIEWLG